MGRDLQITAALFFLTLLSRIPFRTSMLYAWDSVLYAKAIDRFDVTIHQPQPPGHLFYVGLVWLFSRIFNDLNASMVWISVLSSAAAVAAIFWLGKKVFNRRVGIWAALLLATSLSFWAHSEVALPYTLLGLLSIAVAGTIWGAWRGAGGNVVLAGAAMGLASGFREDILLFLFPLFLIALIGKPLSRVITALLVLAAAILSWYVPSALLSGGFSAYRAASSLQSNYLIENASFLGVDGVGAIGANLWTLLRFVGWALAASIPLVAVSVTVMARKPKIINDRRFQFLVVWAAPAILFHIFMQMGELGYAFTFLPPLLLLLVWAMEGLRKRLLAANSWNLKTVQAMSFIVPVALIMLNTGAFLFFSPKLSASSLAHRDKSLRATIDMIKDNFDPRSTLIVAAYEDEHVSYYLPEFRHFKLDPMVKKNVSATLDPDIRQVVILEEYLSPALGKDPEGRIYAGDRQLRYLIRDSERQGISIDWRSHRVSLKNQ